MSTITYHSPRIPIFYVVPIRARKDGWTPVRQAEFIGWLAETRNVAEAARRVGMTRETAYRLRSRPWSGSFCMAWDSAVRCGDARGRATGESVEAFRTRVEAERQTPLPKVTVPHLQWRIETGRWQVIMRAGRYRGVRQKADDSALFALFSRTRNWTI